MLTRSSQAAAARDTPAAVLEQLAFESLKERRRARRWSIFFRSLLAIYLLALFVGLFWQNKGFGLKEGSHTAVVDIAGVIQAGGDVDADLTIAGIERAFESAQSEGVILRINSPGGSAVQSGRIYDELMRQRSLHPDKPLYAVIDDICASGGYYIASAADEIYANRASLVGSIGVIMASFGFVDSMEKIGVERRLISAGENKAMLDPFSPLDGSSREKAQQLVAGIHDQFIDAVRKGRGDRLKETDATFSGTVWTGEAGVEIGLIDALGDARYVAREIVQAPDLVNYTPSPHLVDQITERLGVRLLEILGIERHGQGVQMR